MFNTSDDEEDALGDGEGFTPGDVTRARLVATEGLEEIVNICGTEAGVREVATVVSHMHCSSDLEAVGVDIVEGAFMKMFVEALLTEEVSCDLVDFHTGEEKVAAVLGLAKGRVGSRRAGRFSSGRVRFRSRAGSGGRNRGFGVPGVTASAPEVEGNSDSVTDVRVSTNGEQKAGGNKIARGVASDVVEATVISANDTNWMPEVTRVVDVARAGNN